MAEDYYPFDSGAGANSAQGRWARMARLWAPSGVVGPPNTTDYQLSFNGLTATIGYPAGDDAEAWVRGFAHRLHTSPWSEPVPANSASQPLIERIVLRRDLVAQTVKLMRLRGNAAVTPTPPPLTREEDGKWDLPLWRYRVPGGSGTVITDINDERSWVDPGGLAILPSLTAYRAANQVIGAGDAAGVVALDTVEAGAVPGFKLDTATGLITVEDRGQGRVPVDISGALSFIQGNAGTAGQSSSPVRCYLAAQINGVEVRRGQDQHARTGFQNGDLHSRVLPSTRHLVDPGDVIALRYYHNSGQASTIGPGAAVTWMNVRRAA